MTNRTFERVIIGVDPAGPDHDTMAVILYENGRIVAILSEEEYLALAEATPQNEHMTKTE